MIIKVKIYILLTIFFCNSNFGYSQKIWTLNDCLKYALENNIQIKRKNIQIKAGKLAIKAAKSNILPYLNFNASQEFSFAKTTDLISNDLKENNISVNKYNISGSIVLFNGFKNYNIIEQKKLNLFTVLQEIEALKDDIKLNVLSAYMQILFSEEELEISKRQLYITEENLTNATLLKTAGIIADNEIYEIKAQIAYEKYQIIVAESNLKNANLQLTKLLELQTNSIQIEKPKVKVTNLDFYIPDFNRIYRIAQNLPLIKKEEKKLKSIKKETDINKSLLYPKISLNLGINTNWTNAGYLYDTTNIINSPIGYTSFTGEVVYSKSYGTKKYPYFYQIKNNFFPSISINISYPVFDKFRYKQNKEKIKLNINEVELQIQQRKNNLYQDIQQLYSDLKIAIAKYKSAEQYLNSYEKSYKNAELEYKAGKITSFEYSTSVNKLINAKLDFLKTKYEIKFNQNILRFYQNLPFAL
ncbi:MAG: TolC family protein [Bacteroidales bacterium]|nr:TolC family protein [Bacteroidales bacterium]